MKQCLSCVTMTNDNENPDNRNTNVILAPEMDHGDSAGQKHRTRAAAQFACLRGTFNS